MRALYPILYAGVNYEETPVRPRLPNRLLVRRALGKHVSEHVFPGIRATLAKHGARDRGRSGELLGDHEHAGSPGVVLLARVPAPKDDGNILAEHADRRDRLLGRLPVGRDEAHRAGMAQPGMLEHLRGARIA